MKKAEVTENRNKRKQKGKDDRKRFPPRKGKLSKLLRECLSLSWKGNLSGRRGHENMVLQLTSLSTARRIHIYVRLWICKKLL